MLDLFRINLTQLTGLLSFAAATIACVIAARRLGSRDAYTWRLLALINCFLLIETFIGLRYSIHNFFKTMLKAQGLYASLHGGVQEIIDLSIAILALLFVAVLLFWRVVGVAARVAVSLTIVLVALFAIETVSLHDLRAVIYRPVGPVFMIAWLWAIAAAGICWAATQR